MTTNSNSFKKQSVIVPTGNCHCDGSSSLYYTHIKTKQQTCSVYKFSILKNIYVSNYLRLSKFLLIKILLKRSVLILGIIKE